MAQEICRENTGTNVSQDAPDWFKIGGVRQATRNVSLDQDRLALKRSTMLRRGVTTDVGVAAITTVSEDTPEWFGLRGVDQVCTYVAPS